METPGIGTAVVVTGSAVIAAMWLRHRHPKLGEPNNSPKDKPSIPLNGDVTIQFTAAIPEITPLLNLELAVARQTETFTHASDRKLWGMLDLGTSTVQLRVPVTYRYHINLRERWRVEIQGQRVIVEAPAYRPSLPPAIHTDGLDKLAVRGWGRGGTGDQMMQLERTVTPLLNQLAGDARHLELVRNQCRRSVAEFVQLWLEREGAWKEQRLTSIDVRFASEKGTALCAPNN